MPLVESTGKMPKKHFQKHLQPQSISKQRIHKYPDRGGSSRKYNIIPV